MTEAVYTVGPSLVLPSGLNAEVEEMTGEDQAILTDRRLIKSGEAFNLILARRVKINGEALKRDKAEELLEGDRAVLLIHLRRFSLGDVWEDELTCHNRDCGETFPFAATLTDEDVRMTPYPNGTQSRLRVTVKYLDRVKATQVARLVEINLQRGVETRRMMGISNPSLLDRLKVRNPVEHRDDGEERPLDLRAEKAAFIEALGAAVRLLEPDLAALRVEVKCPTCQRPNQIDPFGSVGFLFPSLTSGRTPSI